MNKYTTLVFLTLVYAVPALAADEGVQDMSDPTAVYSQAGTGITNKGLNFKYGSSYDTGIENRMGMNVFEIKGVLGDTFGWDRGSQKDNSIDSLRFRNFELNTTNGRGTQIDVSYDLDNEVGTANYAFMQALPKMGRFQFFPLLGASVVFGNNLPEDDGTTDSGYSFAGTFLVGGMYSKITITDNVWLNYNPFYSQTLSGSDLFKDFGLEGGSSVLIHEFSASYQINPRLNVRYFANWSENIDVFDGDHRIEVNYQL